MRKRLMPFLSVDPISFQAAALAWLGVVTIVAGAGLTVLLTLWPKINELRALARAHDDQIKTNTQAIRRIDPDVPIVVAPKDIQP
jgi:hypothetical protein